MTGFGTVAAMVKAMDEELGITVPDDYEAIEE